MFDDPCPWSLSVCIINCRISLEIRFIEKLCFKAHRAIFQIAHLIIKIRIDRTGIDHFFCKCIILCLFLQIIFFQTNFYSLKHIGNHLCITTNRNSLIQCIKIIIIKGQAHRKSLDDKCRKIFAVTSPLLLSVTFDQFFKNISSNQRNCLFFQVLWFGNPCFSFLFFNLCFCFFRSYHTPHFIEGIHIERQRIQFPMIVCNRTVRKTVKFRKLRDIIPYFLIIRMENMCAIFMNMDFLNLFRIYISCNIRTLVDHKNRFSRFLCFMRKYGSV